MQNLAKQLNYYQTSNIRGTLVDWFVDNTDVIVALPISAAPTTSSVSTKHLAPMDWAKTTAWRDEKHVAFEIWQSYIRGLTVCLAHWPYWSRYAWHQGTWATLVQVMAQCQQAPDITCIKVDLVSLRLCGIHLGMISQLATKLLFLRNAYENYTLCLKLLPYFLWDNDLIKLTMFSRWNSWFYTESHDKISLWVRINRHNISLLHASFWNLSYFH